MSENATQARPRRFALLLEYDGARFAGSQLQSNAVTVQSVLEGAIEKATGERSRVAFAGRTDAGVHAYGQVASFLTRSLHTAEVMLRAVNAWLPADVVARAATETELDFDPRRHAVRRRYRYVIDNRATRPALRRDRAWHVAEHLDVPAMAEAARHLIGRHDFAAFASRPEITDTSTVRELTCLDVGRTGDSVTCEVTANAFLPHQVRRMVGALVEVGKGKLSEEEYAALLKGGPASAGPAAPARGLYLMRVVYKPEIFQGVDSADGVW
jgi:tRNA pseudouridine38-40 synthase